MTEKLRWGFLSTAHISEALLEPLRRSKKNTLLAVASRDPQRSEAYARKHKLERVHPTYESLLADPQVDVIYNPLPNSLHAGWTIKALQAGKHVLCEKPLALSVDEVDAMTEAARAHDRLVVEALMYRSQPLTLKAREVVRSGKLGRLRLVRGTFSYPGVKPEDYRLRPEMGGGSLWDVGIYPLGYARFLLEEEPLEVFGWQTLGATGVDESFVAQCRFPGEISLQFDCSMASPYHTFMEVIGEQATLVIPQPFTPGVKASFFVTHKGNTETITVRAPSLYAGEVDAMADAIRGESPPAVSLADSRAGVAAVQALLESARTGQPVCLSATISPPCIPAD